jgi:hypothetical protein
LRSTAALPYSVRTNFQEGAAVEIEEIDLAASGSSCPRRKWGVGCRPCAGSVKVRNQPVEQRLTLMERVQHNHVVVVPAVQAERLPEEREQIFARTFQISGASQ